MAPNGMMMEAGSEAAFSDAVAPLPCTHHRNQDLELFCKVHNELVCTTCTYTRHALCSIRHDNGGSDSEGDNSSQDSADRYKDTNEEEEEEESPFCSLDEAAHHLTRQLGATMNDKDQELEAQIKQLAITREQMEKLLRDRLAELKADRDRLVQAVHNRYLHLIKTLEDAANPTLEAIKHKQIALCEHADALIANRVAVLDAICAHALDDRRPQDTITTSVNILKQINDSEITAQEAMARSNATDLNLHVHLPPPDRLVEEIQSRGWAGALSFDPCLATLTGPSDHTLSVGSSCSLKLKLPPAAQAVTTADGLIRTKTRVIGRDGAVKEHVVPLGLLDDKGRGNYELHFDLQPAMAGCAVEMEVLVAGQPVQGSPVTVRVLGPNSSTPSAKKAITTTISTRTSPTSMTFNSTILTEEAHKLSLQALHGFLPAKGFRLLYRGTRDGWAAEDFHSRCDGKGPTLTLIRSSTNGSIFGGYTSMPWESSAGQYQADSTAFLFSLVNSEGLGPVKMPVKEQSKAIWNHYSALPSFGKDLCIRENATKDGANFTYVSDTYTLPPGHSKTFLAGTKKFSVEELEVFAVLQ